MLEKPAIPDQKICASLEQEYGLSVGRLAFLPLGADVNTAVYAVDAADDRAFFLKLRKEDFDPISVEVPEFLHAQGIPAVIAPLKTSAGQLWASLEPYRMILYPFITGKNGYEVKLTERQWLDFGNALGRIHSTRLPAALAARIPNESYSAQWRAMVKIFQAQVEETHFPDPVAARLAAFMQSKREVIRRLVDRTEVLGNALQARALEMVLCHADIHAGNLLLPDGADSRRSLYLVDWDNPIFSPKERDLAMIGGSSTWNDPHEEALFYQGYGRREPVDEMALAYFRYERIIMDIAAFCRELLLTSEGGADREQSYHYFTANFLPDHEIDLAMKKDSSLKE